MIRILAKVILAVGVGACGSIGQIGNLADTIPTEVSFSCQAKGPQVRSGSRIAGAVDGPVAGVPVALPPKLATDKVANALVQAMSHVSRGTPTLRTEGSHFTYQGRAPLRLPDFSAKDMERFMEAFAETALRGQQYQETDTGVPVLRSAGDQSARAANLFAQYYRAYIKGEFVTRFGVKLAKPDIGKTIGNEMLSNTLAVFLEAVSDLSLHTPVLQSEDGKKFYPGQNDKQPTAAVLKIVDVEKISSDSSACGITDKEAEAISWLANLAEEKSAIVSGLVLESFSGIELSFVLGGHFAIGDNQTLAALTKTFAGTSSKYLAEYAAYQFFWHFAYTLAAQPRSQSGDVVVNAATPIIHLDSLPRVSTRSGEPGSADKLRSVAAFLGHFQ